MNRSRSASIARLLSIPVILFLLILPLMSGCDFIDQLIEQITGGGLSGGNTANAPTAVITAVIDDDAVTAGLNPDLRPPLWYQLSSAGSLSEYGDSIYDGNHSLAWDFGDGILRGFEWSDRGSKHNYKQEGTYIVSLTVRADASGASDTVQKTITIGPAWLEILSLTWEYLPDGRADYTVVVRNQSRQSLRGIAVDLYLDGSLTGLSFFSAVFSAETTPVSLPPGATYTLHNAISSSWNGTGTLTASSGWCVAYPLGQ